jgi:hypothetical protein
MPRPPEPGICSLPANLLLGLTSPEDSPGRLTTAQGLVSMTRGPDPDARAPGALYRESNNCASAQTKAPSVISLLTAS